MPRHILNPLQSYARQHNFYESSTVRTVFPVHAGGIAFCETMAWFTRPQNRSHYYYFEHGKSMGYFNSTFKGLLTMPLSINFWMLAETLRLDLSAGLSRITCPTLLVRSTSDPYLTEQEVADMTHRMPHARAATIMGDSHFLASRNQDLLAQELLPFLETP